MNQADLLAIKVAVTNVAYVQRQLQDIKNRAEAMNKQSDSSWARGTRQFAQWMQQNRQHKSGVETLVGSYARLAAMFASVGAAGLAMFKSIQSFEQLKGFRMGLAEMVGGPSVARDIERQLRAFSALTGTRATSFMPNVQSLAGTESAAPNEIVPLIRAFTALAKKTGAMPDQINRAFTQFTQVASAGKLQGDELRIMQENMVNLRGLLKRAGLGDRIGSQTAPITFDEIKKALLEFGNTSEAAKFLKINSDSASAAFNRLFDTLMLDVLPVFGKMLTPAAVRLSDWLNAMAKKATPQIIEKYSRKFVDFIDYITRFIQKEGPAFLSAIGWLTEKIGVAIQGFTDLDKRLNGGLMKTLLALGAVRVASGAAGAMAGGVGGAAGGALGALIGGMFRSAWAVAIPAIVSAVGSGLAIIQLGLLGETIAGITAAVGVATSGIVALGAAAASVGLLIGHLINQIPGVARWHQTFGEWVNDHWQGSARVKAEAAMAHPDFLPGGRIYEKRMAQQALSPAHSARRSDPQRLITEGGANGLRYAR